MRIVDGYVGRGQQAVAARPYLRPFILGGGSSNREGYPHRVFQRPLDRRGIRHIGVRRRRQLRSEISESLVETARKLWPRYQPLPAGVPRPSVKD